MTWSLSKPSVHAARDVDSLIAAEWALADLGVSRPRARYLSAIPGGGAPEEETRQRAEATRQEAESQERARRDAERERERALKEAYQKGYEEGLIAGELAESTRLRNAVQAAEQALDEVREGEMRWTGSIEENICALAVAIARQVVARELKGDMEAVVELVRRALGEFPIDQPVRIRVNSGDLAAIEASATAEDSPLRGREARWIPDARVAPGGCIVEGRERIVDGRVDTSLERIYRRLTYAHV